MRLPYIYNISGNAKPGNFKNYPALHLSFFRLKYLPHQCLMTTLSVIHVSPSNTRRVYISLLKEAIFRLNVFIGAFIFCENTSAPILLINCTSCIILAVLPFFKKRCFGKNKSHPGSPGGFTKIN